MSEKLRPTALERHSASYEPGLQRVLGVIREKITTIVRDDPALKAVIIETAQASPSFLATAEQVIPESVVIDPTVAESVVAGVLKQALTEEEYKALTARNMLSGRRKAAKAAREALGMIEWSAAERARLRELAPIHLHDRGRQKGRPNCVAIAAIINAEFHDGRNQRNADGVSKALSQEYKAGFSIASVENETVDVAAWSEEENAALLELMATVLHQTGKWYDGHPDFEAIAAELNTHFHSKEQDEGVNVRTANTCLKHATLLRRRLKKVEDQTTSTTTGTTKEAAVNGLSGIQSA